MSSEDRIPRAARMGGEVLDTGGLDKVRRARGDARGDGTRPAKNPAYPEKKSRAQSSITCSWPGTSWITHCL